MQQPVFVDAEQITAHYGASPQEIDAWCQQHRIFGLPAPDHHDEGSHAVWSAEDVDVRLKEPWSMGQLTELLGLSQSTLRQPGYFVSPDLDEPRPAEGRGRPPRMHWWLISVIVWDLGRPGSGRRSGAAAAKLPPLPDVTWETLSRGEGELCTAPEAAALLGFSNSRSFSSALSQGHLPELQETVLEVRVEGRPWQERPVYPVRAVRAAAKRRGVLPAEEEMLDLDQVAALLGVSSGNSLSSQISRGRRPELEDVFVPHREPGQRGRARRKAPRSVIERILKDRNQQGED